MRNLTVKSKIAVGYLALAMLMLALASVSLVVTLMGKLTGGPRSLDQKRVQLTGAAGSESYPAFSPVKIRVTTR